MSRSVLYFPSKVTDSPESSRRTIVRFSCIRPRARGPEYPVVELCRSVPKPNSEVETAGGDQVERRGVLGNTHGVVQRQKKQERPDPKASGPCCDGGSDRQQRRRVAVIDEVVLGEPRFVEPHLFGLRHEIEVCAVKLIPGHVCLCGIPERPQQAELQRHRRARRRPVSAPPSNCPISRSTTPIAWS